MGQVCGNGVVAFARVVGPICGNVFDLPFGRELAGQYRCAACAAAGDLDRPDLKRLLIHLVVDRAPDEPFAQTRLCSFHSPAP